jgi:hypothetical protein
LPGSRDPWNRSAKREERGGRGRLKREMERWRKHDEEQRGINSGHDARGSAANRVRRLPTHSLYHGIISDA